MYKENLIDQPIYSVYCINSSIPMLKLGSINYNALNLTLHSQIAISYSSELYANFSYENIIFSSYPVEISSIYSYISGPYEILQEFFEHLIKKYNCYNYIEHIICDCKKTYPDISFYIPGKILKIKATDYLKKVKI